MWYSDIITVTLLTCALLTLLVILLLVRLCVRAGKWERAIVLLAEMRERGITPTVQCYTSAITACGQVSLLTLSDVLLLYEPLHRGCCKHV
jgi:pentatricopeptide repeat protein